MDGHGEREGVRSKRRAADLTGVTNTVTDGL